MCAILFKLDMLSYNTIVACNYRIETAATSSIDYCYLIPAMPFISW